MSDWRTVRIEAFLLYAQEISLYLVVINFRLYTVKNFRTTTEIVDKRINSKIVFRIKE